MFSSRWFLAGAWVSGLVLAACHGETEASSPEAAAVPVQQPVTSEAPSEAAVLFAAGPCAGVPAPYQDLSPFHFRGAISAVTRPSPDSVSFTFGDFTKHAREPMRKFVECHHARLIASHFAMPDMDDCPLAIPGLSVEVEAAEQGLVVVLTATDPSSIDELRARAAALEPGANPAGE